MIILVTGMGGTGKSAIVRSIAKRIVDELHGRLVITAYTGVAAAPFFAATALSLLTISINPAAHVFVEGAHNVSQVNYRREKFRQECGIDQSDIAGIVVDEHSFDTAKTTGHFDFAFREQLGVWDLPFGGVPTLFTGDNFQKCCPSRDPWYVTLMQYTQNSAQFGDATVATCVGARIMAEARRFQLKINMRARDDPPFAARQLHTRDTLAADPLTRDFLDSIGILGADDIEKDPLLCFAPVGVMSHFERDYINHKQVYRFAQAFGLPIFKWKKQFDYDGTLVGMPEDLFYAKELNAWWYFVPGAPQIITETIKSVRGIVNGTPCLQDDLIFDDDGGDSEALYGDALRAGRYQEVILPTAPAAIVVRVGSKPRSSTGSGAGDEAPPYTWFDIELPDLSDKLVDFVDGATESDGNLIPIRMSTNVMELDTYAIETAQHGIDPKPRIRGYKLETAFAMIDYKLQGRTLLRLLLNIINRKAPPYMTLESAYVLISRVTTQNGLRYLVKDDAAIEKLLKLRHNPLLHAWEHGYDDNGDWDVERALKALDDAKTAQTKSQRKRRSPGDGPSAQRLRRSED